MHDADGEGGRAHVTVGGISGDGGLADHDRVRRDAVGDDLEERSVGESDGLGKKGRAVGVLARSLVVELDIVPVNKTADLGVDVKVAAAGVGRVSYHP